MLRPFSGAVLAQVVKNFEKDDLDFEWYHCLAKDYHHSCDAEGNVFNGLGEVVWRVKTISQESDAFEEGSVRVKREDLDEHEIEIVMAVTGYSREIVAMNLMQSDSEVAKSVTAILGPKDASGDADTKFAW